VISPSIPRHAACEPRHRIPAQRCFQDAKRTEVEVSMTRGTRHVVVFLLVSALLPGSAIAAKGRRAPARCTIGQSHGALVTTVPLRIQGHRLKLDLMTAGTPTGPRTSSLVLSRGRTVLLQSHGSISAAGFTLTIEFGAAVRGIRTIELASADGRTVTGTVDGRALAPFALGSAPGALAFADGGASPRVRIKPVVRQALRKLSTLDLAACAAAGSPALVSPRPLLSDCELCLDACFIAYWSCNTAALIALGACEAVTVGAGTPLCVPTYLLAAAGCHKAMFDCSTACTNGTSCCPVPCAGGHGVAISDTAFCQQTCSDGAVCCGGASDARGQCCDKAADCCGATCLEGLFAGDRCVNPSTGAFCFKEFPGDVCGDTSQPTSAFCCPVGAPVCRDAGKHVCCPAGAGEVCSVDGQAGCCPPNAPRCIKGSACCAPQDVCGAEGACCPPPHVCLGQTCCNPPSTVCGAACCDEFSTCVDAERSLCCASLTSVVCGSNCCDGLTERCVGGQCCPLNSACGSVCCPPGEFCTNPGNGTCSPCAPGKVACQVEGGPSICCEQGQACCAGPPPVCCSDPTQQTCCGSPTVQCHDAGFCIR
jgi:hypothetical protein